MKRNGQLLRATQKLAQMELANCGRWCNITLKKTGEVLTLIRTGYGPMEYPQGDSHKLQNSQGQVLVEAESLEKVAQYILGL